MIRIDIKRTKLFSEFSPEEQEKYFKTRGHTYIPNIDSLYYSAFIRGDCVDNKDDNMLDFLSKLQLRKDTVLKNKSPEYWFEDIELKLTGTRFSIYEYCLSIEGMCDIFIASYLPNGNTPRIVIQLRSIALWIDGADELIYKSFNVVQRVLSEWNLVVERTQENRIDFCYHTNNIQSMYKYFNDDLIKNNCTCTFHDVGKHLKKYENELVVDYVSFGKRQSNNIFVRIYNKTKEVIEKGYKGFFIDYWHKEGLISAYDRYVYEYAYEKGSYNSLEWGKIEFYLTHGKDYRLKQQLELLKQDYGTNLEYVRKFIKDKLPDVTLITNIEYQTMRKFYWTMDKVIDTFDHTSKLQELNRLFRIIDNRKLFLDYLTSTSLAFVKTDYKKLKGEDIYLDWWKRLRKVKLKCITAGKVTRDYSKKLDFNRLQSRLKGTIASMSLYIDCETDTNLNEDIASVLCALNDNDFERHSLQMIQTDTGEILNFEGDYDYKRIKENKKKSLKSLVKKTKETSKSNN